MSTLPARSSPCNSAPLAEPPPSAVRARRAKAASSPAVPPPDVAWKLCRDSELNAEGRKILAVAETLLDMLSKIERSNAEGNLLNQLTDAGFPDVCERYQSGLLYKLDEMAQDCSGFIWVLQQFVGRMQCATITPASKDTESVTPNATAERKPR